MTPTNRERVKTLFRQAAVEKAIVLIDELNTFPYEKMLNYFLDQGVFVIGTQNPKSAASIFRFSLSPAVIDRMPIITVPDYSPKETVEILWHEGLTKDLISALLKTSRQTTLRGLLRESKAHKSHLQSQEPTLIIEQHFKPV